MSGASSDPRVERFARHVNPSFVRLLGLLGYGRLLVRARDVWIEDHTGARYLDCLAGFGSVNVGHNHPRLVGRLKAFLDEGALNFVHVGPCAQAGELGERLAALAGSGLEVALFGNGGADAVEGALKLARAVTGRSAFVSFAGGFHGTSLGTLSVLGEERMRAPFEPLLPGCRRVPWGDLDALRAALVPGDVAGVLLDPWRCEFAAAPPPPGWLSGVQALCRRYGALLLVDEVQTGLHRTGPAFAFQAEPGLRPDALCLAKSLSGGIAPIGATLVSQELFARAYGRPDRFDLHSSTFGGNAFSCVAGLETLAILGDERLGENARARGAELLAGLRARLDGHPLVREVRGEGLLVSIELGPTGRDWASQVSPRLVERVAREVFGQWAAVRLLEAGLIVQPASQHWNVLKLEPPLTIAAPEVARVIDTVAAVLGEYRGLAQLVAEVGARLGRQWLAGWSF